MGNSAIVRMLIAAGAEVNMEEDVEKFVTLGISLHEEFEVFNVVREEEEEGEEE